MYSAGLPHNQESSFCHSQCSKAEYMHAEASFQLEKISIAPCEYSKVVMVSIPSNELTKFLSFFSSGALFPSHEIRKE